ncbi:MAG: polysaccharide biosynthesis/export family protein [Vicinamibacterales bacterium]
MTPTVLLKTAALGALGCLLVAPAAGAQNRPAPAPEPAPVATSGTAAPAAPRATASRNWTDQEYRLGPGDKLRVEVYREPQLSQSLQVRPDGRITLPLVGDVTAAGTTASQLRATLTESLKEFVQNPVVTVIVTDALAAQVYVIGEVSAPGAQIMQGPMTVLQALAQAGGLKEFAKKGDIRVLRKSPTGITTTLSFDYKAAINGSADALPLQPGDTIVVP